MTMTDYEDFTDEEDYWAMVCEHQDLCGKCYAPWYEHGDEDGNGRRKCPA